MSSSAETPSGVSAGTKKIALFVFLVFYFTPIEACQCGYTPTGFIETINYYQHTLGVYSILKGYKITDTLAGGIGCKYVVLQNLHGPQTSDTIDVWGDPGWTCLAKPKFNVGDTTIVIVFKYDTVQPGLPYIKAGDYYSQRCGVFTMLFRNDSVLGGHVTNFKQYSFDDFIDTLNYTMNNLPTSLEDKELSNKDIHIYPNPCRDILNVEGNFEIPIFLKVRNIFGQQIILKEISTNTIDISELINGQYFIEIIDKQNRKHNSTFVKSY